VNGSGSNTAVGQAALYELGVGSSNVALGMNAGYALVNGNNNVYLGSTGDQSAPNESNTIRIGNMVADGMGSAPHTKTYIAGVYGATTALSGSAVVVDANGQLGTVLSSRRYKEDINAMGSASERLYQLRPVTFRYKQADRTGAKPIQFGLIAEEVAEVFPELVVYNKDGKPETVAYHLLSGLLLNELQKEHATVETQSAALAAAEARLQADDVLMASQAAELAHQESQIQAQARLLDEQTRQLAAVRQQVSDVESLRTEVAQVKQLQRELEELRQVAAKALHDETVRAVKTSAPLKE